LSKSPAWTALFHPLNIAMAALTVFAGLMSAWWLFPVGGVLWLVMVLAVSRDRALRFNAELHRRQPLAQRFQRAFDRLVRVQVSVFNTLASSPTRTRRALQPVQDEIDCLVEEAYALCRRMTALENYLVVSNSQSELAHGQSLDDLKARIEQTADPALREDYMVSYQSQTKRLAKLEEVAMLLDRVDARLVGLVHELDGVVTEIVRLQAAGPESVASYADDIVRSLQQETEQLHAFEQQAIRL
jgi:hypothetical protein